MGSLGFIYDQSLCIGCNACQIACRDCHNQSMGIFLRRADTIACEKDGKQMWMHVSAACNHCTDAPCVAVCSRQAMHVEEDGTVGHDPALCIGCGKCAAACPVHAIVIDQRIKKAVKCDSCMALRLKGQNPACVDACPMEALAFGELGKYFTSQIPYLPEKEDFHPNIKVHMDEKYQGVICTPFVINQAIEKKSSTEKGSYSEKWSAAGSGEKIDGRKRLREYASFFRTGEEGANILSGRKDAGNFADGKKDAVNAFNKIKNFQQNKTELCRLYDRLFRGTDPNLQLPLWASVMDGTQTLLNQTTLDIIHIYHKAGYEPEWMEGNPPDYIGEQMAYLSYLADCYAGEKKIVLIRLRKMIRTFAEMYTVPTLEAILKELGKYRAEKVVMERHTTEKSTVGKAKAEKTMAGEYTVGKTEEEKAVTEEAAGKTAAEIIKKETEKVICDREKDTCNPDSFEMYREYLQEMLVFLQDKNLVDYCAAAGRKSVSVSQSVNSRKNSLRSRTDRKADEAGSVIPGRIDKAADPYARTLNPPIPDEEPHTINTGGINNCGGICVIRPTVADNCMLRIESDCNPNHDPKIRACVRGRGYRNTFLNSGRLKYPMKRVGKRGSGQFERISWVEAVDILAKEWVRIRDTYGPGSRYIQYGTGVEGIMRPGKLMRRLLSLDGGSLDYFNSYSSACVNGISSYVYGTSMSGSSAADMLHTKLLILWADNTAESVFGPERRLMIARAKKQGVKVIVIDPRLSQTGIAFADEWIAIRPSTDAALADAMAYVIWSEGLQDQAFMDRYCIGFDEDHMPDGVPAGLSYHSYLFGKQDGVEKTPEWAETITGLEAETIRRLARELAAAHPACISVGLGAQRHGNGEQSARGIMMLCCLTGNVGIPGGSAGTNSSCMVEHEGIDLFTGRLENPYPGKIPVFLWTKAIEKGTSMTPEQDRLEGVEKLDSNIKLLFNLASDVLINQHSDINDTIRILEDESLCELIVCSDIFMTPSARYADLILPATSVFEGDNIINPWAGGNYLMKNNQVIRPLFGCRFEWEWMKELAEKVSQYDQSAERRENQYDQSAEKKENQRDRLADRKETLYDRFVDGKTNVEDWLRENYEVLREREPELPDYETFSREGGYQYREPVECAAFREQIADPENHPFATPSEKIEIFSKTLYELRKRCNDPKISPIPGYIPCADGPADQKKQQYPLQLIGWHTRRRCHTIHDNNAWQDEVEMPSVWIHPEDAAARGIEEGDLTEVYNGHGKVCIPAHVTSRIMKGVAAMAQGAWYTPDSEGTDTRGSINVLTGTAAPSPIMKGNPQHTNLVEIRKK